MQQGRRRLSEFHIRLLEKQKLRAIYRVNEKQMRRYYERATSHQGVTGEVLIRQLENLAKVAIALGDGRERGIIGLEAEKSANPGYRGFLANGYNVTRALVLLRARYPQYRAMALDGPEHPVVRITPERIHRWRAA